MTRAPTPLVPRLALGGLCLMSGAALALWQGGHLLQELGDVANYGGRADLYLIRLGWASVWTLPLAVLAAWGLAGSSRVRRLMSGLGERVERAPDRVLLRGAVIAFLVLAATSAWVVIGHTPRVFDAFNYTWQALCFAQGRASAPIPECSDLFRFPFIMMEHGRWYGSVYPGFPLLLAAGVLLGSPWLVSPVLGALAVRETYLLGRRLHDRTTASWSAILALSSPFLVLLSSIFMSHAAATFLCLASVRKIHEAGEGGSRLAGLLAGGAAGLALITRPQALVPVAGPWLLWWILRIVRRRSAAGPLVLAAVPVVLLLAANLAYNRAITGDPWVNPRYEVSPYRRLGFGPDIGYPLPGGGFTGHTPLQGIANTRINMRLLNAELLGWPTALALGPLTFLLLWGALAPARRLVDLLLLAGFLGNVAVYVAYFTPSPNFGPRYYTESAPLVLLLVVRGIAKLGGARPPLEDQAGERRLAPTARWARPRLAVLILSLFGLLALRPAHLLHYGWLPETLERRQVPGLRELDDALVLVPPDLFRANVLVWNRPTLDGPVVWAPDGDPSALDCLRASHPDRAVYRYVPGTPGGVGALVPIPRAPVPEARP